MKVFLFGAGRAAAVRDLLGLPREGRDGVLRDWRAVCAPRGLGANLERAPGQAVPGTLVELPEGAPALAVWAALGAIAQEVTLDDQSAALAFSGDPAEGSAPWDQAAWAAEWEALYHRAAGEFLGLAQRYDAAQLRRSRDQVLMRAASWVRAQAETTPMELRRGYDAADVEARNRRHPYLDYFQVEEHDLRVRQFSGAHGPEVKRACFLMGDAVTVLPYDPVRDRVLLVEQFRYAPLVRGDRRPWALEPIAGRIDPGESPEAAARRESQEEAKLSMRRLHQIGAYYPSPGAVTEYLFSYVGEADLPDDAAGIGGLEEEAEDIRAFVLSFDELMALLASGEAQTGPLILSALWLQANRARLGGSGGDSAR